MSLQNLILGNSSSKPNQELKVKSVSVDTIYAQNVDAPSPATEVTFNNNIVMNGNDITGIGTLEASNIIGDISDDVIDVNDINQKDNGFIRINNDSIVSGDFKITQIPTRKFIDAPGYVHVQSNGDCPVWMEADKDNVNESDNPFLVMSQDGGSTAYIQGIGENNAYQFKGGFTSNSLGGVYEFFTFQVVNNGNLPPTLFELPGDPMFRIESSGIQSFRDLDMDQNTITNVPNLENTLGNITLTTQNNGFVVLNPNSNLVMTDSYISFNVPSGTPSVPAPGGFQGYLYKSAQNLLWKTPAGTTILNNVYGSEFDSLTSATLSTTTSLTYVNALNLVSGVLPAGDYMIQWSADVSNSNSTTDKTQVRAQIDGTTTLSENTTPQMFGASEYTNFSGSSVQTLTNASHAFTIDFAASASTAQIRNKSIQIWRVS